MKALNPKKIRCQMWVEARWDGSTEERRQCANNSVDNARYCPQHGSASRDFVQQFLDWTEEFSREQLLDSVKDQEFLDLVKHASEITNQELKS